MMSLTRRGYINSFYVVNVLNNDSGLFGPTPTNPRLNICGGAAGIWHVSAVAREELVVK